MHWSLLVEPWFKLNIDGVTFATHKSVGIRAVIRDYTRRVGVALSKKLYAHLGPLEIEAKALEEGVSFAWDANIRDLVVESDSHIVIDTLRVMAQHQCSVY